MMFDPFPSSIRNRASSIMYVSLENFKIKNEICASPRGSMIIQPERIMTPETYSPADEKYKRHLTENGVFDLLNGWRQIQEYRRVVALD
jgi:hypothetical protein